MGEMVMGVGRKLARLAGLALAVLIGLAPASAGLSVQSSPASGAADLRNEMDVLYGRAAIGDGEAELRLDIYQPTTSCTSPRPFVLMIHGGGFRQGSKSDAAWTELARTVSAAGYVAISIDYRLEGEKPVPSEAFAALRARFIAENPQQPPRVQDVSLINAVVSATEDAHRALDWVQDNAASRCIDPQRFAVWGSSAGAIIGHTISYGLDDFGVESDQPRLFVDYWGRAAFPGLMAPGDPALFIQHGTADPVVAFSYAEALESEAVAAGLDYEFHAVDGAGHGFAHNGVFPPDGSTPSRLSVTMDFLERHLPL
jgi:acetyl esterase/lipase